MHENHLEYIDLLYRTMHDVAESPRAAFGGVEGDLSGVALEIELHPLLQKIKRKRTIRTAAYNRRSEMALKLIGKYTGENFGNFTNLYNGIPIAVNDWILDTHTLVSGVETATTGGANSVIYALGFGEGGVCGVTGPGAVQVEPVGVLESKDATRTRIKWYVALADFCLQKRGALIGVQD